MNKQVKVVGDVEGGTRPQYAILVEAGWPGGYRMVAPRSQSVGLKPRRQPGNDAPSKTFSVQDPDWEQVEAFKAWCRAREVTFKSAFDVAIREFLILHS